MSAIAAIVGARLDTAVPAPVIACARNLARQLHGDAVLFYGSALRTPDLDGVLDFYVLHAEGDGASQHRALAFMWPDVSYHELEIGDLLVRAKVARMPLATFEAAAAGQTADTTIWARFAQPSRLLFARDRAIADRVRGAIVDCVLTASRFAAVLGPSSGPAMDYWKALFSATYGAEFRVEAQGRSNLILAADPDYYAAALADAWARLGLIPDPTAATLHPDIDASTRRQWRARWRRHRRLGKPLNIMRLIKAAWTFDGAARYALWKIERHSGVRIPLTRWRERHPVLAAPGVLYRLWRAEHR